MPRVIMGIIMRVKGNVNADESFGNRITIKKLESSDGKIRPFVSARAVRRGIRERFLEKGFEIDPQFVEGKGSKAKLFDIGDPIKFVDDDVFGYLAIKKKAREKAGEGIPRKSPVKVSYLLSMKHAEISVERGGRFPRPNTEGEVFPTPFEVEVADFTGLLNVMIEDRIGVFRENELKEEILNKYKEQLISDDNGFLTLPKGERKRRVKALLEILLKEGWLFPRASRSFNSADFVYSVVVLTDSFIPLGAFIDLDDDNRLDMDKLSSLVKFYANIVDDLYVVDYGSGEIARLDRESGGFVETNFGLDDIIESILGYLIG